MGEPVTEVYIEKGDQRETFSESDANDLKKVKARFALDHEHACVFKVKG